MERNFGQAAWQRISGLSGQWKCFLCNPVPMEGLKRRQHARWGFVELAELQAMLASDPRRGEEAAGGSSSKGRKLKKEEGR